MSMGITTMIMITPMGTVITVTDMVMTITTIMVAIIITVIMTIRLITSVIRAVTVIPTNMIDTRSPAALRVAIQQPRRLLGLLPAPLWGRGGEGGIQERRRSWIPP